MENYKFKNVTFLKACIKMEKIIKLGEIEIQKQNIYLAKIGTNKIVVFNRMSFGKNCFEYLIGYKDAEKIKLLCIFLQKHERI